MKSIVKLLFLVAFSSIYSQNKTTIIANALDNYFINNKYSLHVHLNKTNYITGEEIWFTAYSFKRDLGIINKTKQNIVVGLYDENNIEIDKSLLFLESGTSSGNILLKKELKSGTYYIKAFDIAMNILDQDESFIQPIKIINPDAINPQKSDLDETVTFDLQILPEGGHLVSNVNNTCGIKIINNYGKGVKLKDFQLLDENGTILIKNIKTNTLGMGKFNFVPKSGVTYLVKHLKAPIKKSLPTVKEKGLVLTSVQNFKTGDLQIIIETNEETLNTIVDEEVTLFIHKDKLSKGYTIKFENGFPKIIFSIPNKDLFTGVNTITVFNNKQKPLLERLFFNSKSIKPVESIITEVKRKKDTFSYAILNKLDKQTITGKTSISVLPITSVANTKKSSIYASVYLKPFLKGYIENPDYYFKKNDNQKLYEIDLLLLNQGWRKYDWNSIFRKKASINTITSTSGITIKGYVVALNNNETPINVLLYSKDNKKMELAELNEKLQFEINGLNFTKNSSFKFTASDKKGKPIKANFFYTISPRKEQLNSKYVIQKLDPFNSQDQNKSIAFSQFEGEELDEVVVNAKKLKFKKITRGRYGVKVDSSLYGYSIIADYFKSTEGLILKVTPRGLKYFYPRLGTQEEEESVIIVDGKLANISNGLLNIQIKNVEELYHGGRDGFGNRMPHLVFTDGNYNLTPENLKTSKEFTIEESGFSNEKEFYTPLYINYESTDYKKYGTISWHKNVITNTNGYAKISLSNPGMHDLIFYIEGISETGEPIANVVTVKNKTKP